MKHKQKIGMVMRIVGVLLSIVGVPLIIIMLVTHTPEITKEPCYDNRGGVILGLECERESSPKLMILPVLMLGIGLPLILCGFLGDWKYDEKEVQK